ncbi:MAG: MinD/ParA family protein [Lachnospiraceae bacterium]|nr:MinD/ParA family protein [Lachnospiraceae bacterium]
MDQAEKLRNIIKAQNDTQERQARVITVTSGKGGVGKSSVSINLALQFRKQGKSVIIFDADFGLANIEVMFGAIPKYNLADMIFRGKEFKDIIVEGPEGIGFISGGSGINGLGNMNKDQVQYLVFKLKELEKLADIIIIDTGAGISDSVLEFVVSSSEVLLVTTPEPTSITDAYALLKTLSARSTFDKDYTEIKVITNRVSSYEEGRNLYNKLEVVVCKFLNINLKYLGIIPMDANMSKAVMQQKPISSAYPNSAAAEAIEKLAVALLNNTEVEESKRNGLAKAVMNIFENRFKK